MRKVEYCFPLIWLPYQPMAHTLFPQGYLLGHSSFHKEFVVQGLINQYHKYQEKLTRFWYPLFPNFYKQHYIHHQHIAQVFQQGVGFFLIFQQRFC